MLQPRRRRTALRRAHRSACQAVATERFRSVSDTILDLSHRGARLALTTSVEPGETLVVSFPSPHGSGFIDAVAEVRTIEDGAAGVSFTELPWDARAALFVQLAGVPPPVPTSRRIIDYAATVRRIARLNA
ncbi:MAG: PilZ domain-containing protein [Sandaracinaceae bacterium]